MKNFREKLNQIRFSSLEIRRKWFRIVVLVVFFLVFFIWLLIEGRWLFFSQESLISKEKKPVADFWGSLKNGILVLKERIRTGFYNFSFIMKGLMENF